MTKSWIENIMYTFYLMERIPGYIRSVDYMLLHACYIVFISREVITMSIKSTITLQLNGKDYDFNSITKDSVAAAQKIKKDVKAVNVYVNAKDSAAYFTVDGAGSADYKINL